MMAGTFAKYTSEYAGADTALIAKWAIAPTGGQEGDTTALSDVALDLFSHAYNTNILATAGTTDPPIIAPGVQGEFFIKLVNTGDVAAKMTFEFDEDDGTAQGVPIEYSLNDTNDWGDLAALKTDLEALPADAQNGLDAMASVSETDGVAQATVHWKWAFEQTDVETGDTADTALGVASAGELRTTYILTITATATQIAPTEPTE